MGLSLVEALRRFRYVTIDPIYLIVSTAEAEVRISPYRLLRLYRFFLCTKSGDEGLSSLKLVSEISGYEKKSHIKRMAESLLTGFERFIYKIIEDKDKAGEEIYKEITKNKNKMREIFSSALYLPLVLAYIANGANVETYYYEKTWHEVRLKLRPTILADYLIHSTFYADLRTIAKRLLEVFSAVYRALPNLSQAIWTASDELVGSVLREVAISAIVSREFYKGDNDIRAFYERVTKDLSLYKLLEIWPDNSQASNAFVQEGFSSAKVT